MTEQPEIMPGGLYEDCAFHPCFCVDVDGDELSGISLIDGSGPRSCSLAHCGPVPLTIEQVVAIKRNHDSYVAHRTAGLWVDEALVEQPGPERPTST